MLRFAGRVRRSLISLLGTRFILRGPLVRGSLFFLVRLMYQILDLYWDELRVLRLESVHVVLSLTKSWCHNEEDVSDFSLIMACLRWIVVRLEVLASLFRVCMPQRHFFFLSYEDQRYMVGAHMFMLLEFGRPIIVVGRLAYTQIYTFGRCGPFKLNHRQQFLVLAISQRQGICLIHPTLCCTTAFWVVQLRQHCFCVVCDHGAQTLIQRVQGLSPQIFSWRMGVRAG